MNTTAHQPLTNPPAMSELLQWHACADKLPDAEMTVLCWRANIGDWHAGWLAGDGLWFECATGDELRGVTHWAEPEGPAC